MYNVLPQCCPTPPVLDNTGWGCWTYKYLSAKHSSMSIIQKVYLQGMKLEVIEMFQDKMTELFTQIAQILMYN